MVFFTMARQLRIEYEGTFCHVTSRGNQRTKVFWDDKGREEFKRILERTKERYSYALHAYVVDKETYLGVREILSFKPNEGRHNGKT